MFRLPVVLVLVVIAAAAAAQSVRDLKEGSERPATMIPEIPAGADPMGRKPDPAEDRPASTGLPQPAGTGSGDADCHVRRADTDTGFVVVCVERDGG